MKRAELFHPRVFNDKEWAEGYYKRNAKNITRVGKRLAAVLKRAGFEGGKIFDSGCGFGAVAIELARTFPEAEIIGVDLGLPLLDLGRSLAEQAGVGDQITLLEGDVQKLDYAADSFDLVVNSFMAHIVEDPVTMFNEIERVTKPDGRIMITDLRRIWLGVFIKKLKTPYTLDEGKSVISKSNIRPGKCLKGPFWWDYMAGID